MSAVAAGAVDGSARAAPRQPLPVDRNHPELNATYAVISRPPMPPPPSSRTERIEVEVNCFRVTVPLESTVEYFKYDLAAVNAPRTDRSYAPRNDPPTMPLRERKPLPEWLQRAIADVVMKVMKDQLPRDTCVVYDGGVSLYAPTRLGDWNERTFEGVTVPSQGGARRGGTFDVTVKWVQVIRVADLLQYIDTRSPPVDARPALQTLDIVLHESKKRRFVTKGPMAYNMRSPAPMVGDRTREIVSGVHQTVRMGERGPYVVLDSVQSVFYVPDASLLTVALTAANKSSPSELLGCRDRWVHAVRYVDVYVTHLPGKQTQTVCAVGERDAEHTTFERREKDGSTRILSVATYLFERYGLRLQHPQQPVVNVGKTRRPTWLPIELCKVCAGQRCADNTTASKLTKLRPWERRTNIKTWLRDSEFDATICRAFGVRVDPTMAVVEARVLRAPELYARPGHLTPQDGSWNYHTSSLVAGARLASWCVVNFSHLGPSDLKSFVWALIRKADSMRLDVDTRCLPFMVTPPAGSGVEQVLTDAVGRAATRDRQHVNFMLVILDSDHSDLYPEVKRVAHSVLGVMTQCVVGDPNKLKRPAYINNVVLQVNTKLGGVNCELLTPPPVMRTGTTIIFGVSVDEPRDPDSDARAVAAVVACLDAYGSKFVGRAQMVKRDERPSALTQMMFELLVQFEQEHEQGAVPTKIIYFRDGTSDGDVATVLQSEVQAIHHAWLKFSADAPTPPITFVLVSRSHHVRAFPLRRGDADKSGNVHAGTVLDSVIVDPRRFEFFLYGHGGLIGTSKPALYTVLLNDIGLGVVETEQLCYDLCYTVGRSTRSVAIVSPVRYAQDAEARAHLLLAQDTTAGRADAEMGADTDTDVAVHANLLHLPFFS